jgi:hypothetical protein
METRELRMREKRSDDTLWEKEDAPPSALEFTPSDDKCDANDDVRMKNIPRSLS